MTIVKITKEEQEFIAKEYQRLESLKKENLEVPKNLRFNTQDLQPGQIVYTGNGSIDSFTYTNAYQRLEEPDPITTDHPAMQATLDELSNLWAAKFGDSWVKEEEIQDGDPFWGIATRRLRMKEYLEYFTDLRIYRLCK